MDSNCYWFQITWTKKKINSSEKLRHLGKVLSCNINNINNNHLACKLLLEPLDLSSDINVSFVLFNTQLFDFRWPSWSVWDSWLLGPPTWPSACGACRTGRSRGPWPPPSRCCPASLLRAPRRSTPSSTSSSSGTPGTSCCPSSDRLSPSSIEQPWRGRGRPRSPQVPVLELGPLKPELVPLATSPRGRGQFWADVQTLSHKCGC